MTPAICPLHIVLSCILHFSLFVAPSLSFLKCTLQVLVVVFVSALSTILLPFVVDLRALQANYD